jgi:hypothetical protein
MTEAKVILYGSGIPGMQEQPGDPHDEVFGKLLADDLAKYETAKERGELPDARKEAMPLPRPGTRPSYMSEQGEAPKPRG